MNDSRNMPPEKKGTVCVTGGTGFLASWLIMKLLQHGYSVNTTVRLPSHTSGSKKDTSFLTSLPHAQERLQIFTADLRDPQSFKPAIEGCQGLFHVAHPMDLQETASEEVVIDRSIRGMLGILQACIDSKTVKRVVYTSSAATVSLKDRDHGDGEVMDEGSWSDVEYIRKLTFFGATYCISKTMTERTALEFAEKHGLDLVTVIPPWIVGPFICPNLPNSMHSSLGMIIGKQEKIQYVKSAPFVHTDDIAEAHIYLFEYPEAKGRYICSAVEATVEEVYELLSSRHPEFKLLSPEIISDPAANFTGFSTKKLLETGFKYKYGLEEIFDEAIEQCKQKGFL